MPQETVREIFKSLIPIRTWYVKKVYCSMCGASHNEQDVDQAIASLAQAIRGRKRDWADYIEDVQEQYVHYRNEGYNQAIEDIAKFVGEK